MGSNMAENHPVGFQWVMEARERGAHVIHVDPRFTRTSAMATKWVGIRAGSDIAFLGGIVNYILEHDLHFDEYVKHYTNAPVIINEEYADTEDLDGLFSGWNPEQGEYDSSTWRYGDVSKESATPDFKTRGKQSGHGGHGGGVEDRGPPAQGPHPPHPPRGFPPLEKNYPPHPPEVVGGKGGRRGEGLPPRPPAPGAASSSC